MAVFIPVCGVPNKPEVHCISVRPVNVVLIGFGNVGQAFSKMLMEKYDDLKASHNVDISVIGISTGTHGCTFSITGVSLEACLHVCQQTSEWRLPVGEVVINSTEELLEVAGATGILTAVLEAIPTNLETGEPALTYLEQALKMSPPCHAITASKGPVLHGYASLSKTALEVNRRFLFESSVMDGVPVFSLARTMPGAVITGFDGVLNSTTNIILTDMEFKKCTFPEALQRAQDEGIAERDPSGDIDGHDAAVKLAVLSGVLLGHPLKLEDIPTSGIGHVTPQIIDEVKERGSRMKLLCSCHKTAPGEVSASVQLKEIPHDDMLASLSGASSIIRLHTDVLAPISIISHNPKNSDTAYGLLADLLTAVCNDITGIL